MKSFVTWMLLVLLYGAFGLVAYHALARRAEAGKGMPAYSIYSRDRDGLRELARLLEKLGFEAVPLTRPIQQTNSRGILILVEPQGTALLPGEPADLPDADVRGILHWVDQGNTLLLCSRHMNSLHRQLQATVVTDDQAWQEDSLQEAVLGEAGAYTNGLDRLVIQGNDSVDSLAGLPLWWLGDRPGGILLRRGKGRVFLVADPSLLTLPGLRRGDGNNALFAARLITLHAQDRRVYFDEYHHGLHSGGGFWGYLRYHDEQWTLGAVVLAAAIAAWSVGVRLGKPAPRLSKGRADAVDYASALARIYQRAGARHLLAQSLGRDFQMFLVRHLRLKRTALPVDILAAWRERSPQATPGPAAPQLAKTVPSDARLTALLRCVYELRKGDVAERRLLSLMQSFDQFRSEIQTQRAS
jgi:hypothetical protein